MHVDLSFSLLRKGRAAGIIFNSFHDFKTDTHLTSIPKHDLAAHRGLTAESCYSSLREAVLPPAQSTGWPETTTIPAPASLRATAALQQAEDPFSSYTEQKLVLCSQQSTAAVVTRTRHSAAPAALKYYCYLNHILSAFCSAPCRPHTCSVGLRKWLLKKNQLMCRPHLLQSTRHFPVVMTTLHLKSNYKWLDKKPSTMAVLINR